jgi:RNA polymerase sigma factor (sigma-70 family)
MNATDDRALLARMLERLRQGDLAAAEQLLAAFEPLLRLLVRRQLSSELQAKFDSIDIVQSVWADLIQGLRGAHWQFADVQRLRGFLVRATQNRFIDQVRKHRRAVDFEQPLADSASSDQPAAGEPAPSDEVQAADIWEKLMSLCAPQHREILDLKRQGFSLSEIAARSGLHESSVRRILYDIARRFALASANDTGLRRRSR